MKATDESSTNAPADSTAARGNQTRRRWIGCVAVLLFFGLTIGSVVGYSNFVKNRVKDIQVEQLDSVVLKNTRTGMVVEVERQLWSRVVDNFRSTNVTWKSAKWDALVEVTLHLKDQSTRTVKVYDTGKNPGRFRIGSVQYIGGDERMLVRMMDDEFKRQKKASQAPRAN